MKVLIADSIESEGVEALKALGCSVSVEAGVKAEELPARLAKGMADLLIVRSKKVTRSAIEASVGLRAIIRAGAGVDNIDVAAATERGIGVCNCPGMNAIAVAELTMGLLLSCDRRIPDQTAALRAHRWDKKGFTTGARGLRGSSLCLVGFGAIGRAVAKRAAAFEMKVAAWDRALNPASSRQNGVDFAGATRAELLKSLPTFDAVSVHLALTPQTERFCNAEFFQAMKPGATFVNTSRGGIVDEQALCDAAAAKPLRLGLDVYDKQPSASGVEFVTNVVGITGSAFTHHCGASTDQAQRAVADETVRIVRVFLETGRLENSVNAADLPEVRTHAREASGSKR